MNETSRELTETLGAWCAERAVGLCVLFGSHARGQARPDSDIDLAIWSSRPLEASELLRWRVELTRVIERDVQIVLVTDDLDPVLGMQVAKEGVCLFESRAGLWLEKRVRLWQSYQDALPFLRAARENLRAYAGEVQGGS